MATGERAAGTPPTRPAAGRVAVRERPVGDPVRELMAEYRELCERAVDPLEIAAGLEEAGLGQETAARCRHADLFALADELYARVPRRPPERPWPADEGESWQRRSGAALRTAAGTALPCTAAAAARVLADAPAGPTALLAAVPLGLWLTAVAPGRGRWRPAALAYGFGLAGLLLAPPAVGPGADAPVTAALLVAAALSAGSAQWAARWFRRVGRGHLGTAGTLAEFRSRMRPVLPVAVLLHLAVLAVLTFAALAVLTALAPRPGPGHGGGLLHAAAERAGAGPWAAQGVLGLLLVAAVLLRQCGRAGAAAVAAVGSPALFLAAHAAAPPGAALPVCAAAAVGLLGYAWAVLGRAGAHR